ncbi:MAG: translation initiation factor IF-2 [Clostridia bacterium]|nr:translation initiation factor IF-2 [Clostridia bacterium]
MANFDKLEKIKRLNDTIAPAIRVCVQNLEGTKSVLDSLLKAISQKERAFKEQAIALAKQEEEKQLALIKEQQANEVKPVVEVVEEVKVEEPKKEVVVEEIVETKVEEKVVEAPKKVEQPKVETVKPQPKLQSKPEPQPQQKFQPTVVETKGEGNTKVKTFTDDKGNIRVRKFLDTSRPQKPVQQAKPQQKPVANGPQRDFSKKAPQQNANFANKKPQQQFGVGNQTSNFATQPKVAMPSFVPAQNNTRKDNKRRDNAKKNVERSEENFSKKNLITRSFDDYDDEKVVRKAKTKKQDRTSGPVTKIEHAVVETQQVPIKVLSERIGVTVSEIIKQLFKEGVMKTINDTVEFDYAEYIASMFGVTLELKEKQTADEILEALAQDNTIPDDTKRAPIVTVMGHVDHGKTSLLDAIRDTNVIAGEAGHITQHIGAYTVKAKGEQITFIDTPGHAAFTEMRARGAKITDVAIIVVAADDGIMQQTIEAINHAKAADVSIVVAINKIDREGANIDRVKQQLAEQELVPEEWGGNTICVPISAKKRIGIDSLLEAVLLVSEIKDLKGNPKRKGVGTVLEAKIDKGRGVVATVLVSNGTLHIGDSVIAGVATGKVRAMFDDKGKRVKSAGPSTPVEVLGFSEVPDAGDAFSVADEKLVKRVAQERKDRSKIENTKAQAGLTLSGLFDKISQGELKNLNLIVKTDVLGSYEALKKSLEEISNDEVKISVIHGGVGAINDTDVMLASASNAIVIGFNVRLDAKSAAEKEKVDVRIYNVIYDAVDDVTKAMKGMLDAKYEENVIGTAEVRQVFRISGVGAVAGCYVKEGKVVRNAKVRVYRQEAKIYEGELSSLKRFDNDAKEVAQGFECGMSIANYNDIKVEDIFEFYLMEEVQQ